MVVPCASRFTLFDGSVIGAYDWCEWDKDKMMEYVGKSFNFNAYYNQQEFVNDDFNEESRIRRKSKQKSSYTNS